jgi:hypothetical protein
MGRWDITDIIIMKRITLLMALVVMGLATYANAPYAGQSCSWEDNKQSGASSYRDGEGRYDKEGNVYNRHYKHEGNIRYENNNPYCEDGAGNVKRGGYKFE